MKFRDDVTDKQKGFLVGLVIGICWTGIAVAVAFSL